ncbi:MAG: trigger factor [Patescibacteria group bacterium]
MKVERKDLEKGQIELTIELESEEIKDLMNKAAENISKEVKIEGFRPGKVPFEVLKQKVGETVIMEEAVKISINKSIYKILEENVKDKELVGQPEVDITKLAPGNPIEYKVKVYTLPEVVVGKYKDFGLKKEEVKSVEDEMGKTIENLREMRAKEKISDKEIKDGDKTIASVNLSIDNVPVEDGQNPEVTVLIGKEYFVEGFDKNLIGLKKGDEKEFSLPYPENHWRKNLAGKMVDFKIKIKEVYEREIPEADDELAKAFQFNSLDHLKENLEKTLRTQKEKEIDQKLEVEMLDKIIDGFKFSDIPDVLIKNESSIMLKEVEQSIVSQGANFNDYLKSINKTQQELILDLYPGAVKRVKSALALKEIAKLENISIEEKDIDKEIESLGKRYEGNNQVTENLKNPHYRAYLGDMMLNQKLLKFLKEVNTKNENSSDKQES